jgi:hypothetical protein
MVKHGISVGRLPNLSVITCSIGTITGDFSGQLWGPREITELERLYRCVDRESGLLRLNPFTWALGEAN